ncbi:endonuclease domain-containing protein [Streptomyces sp. NPDC102283]|uniref:endonuclease domain-containing protein n=1 Tax=Streptomyces sp. NPDC102283 TaxID=3366155 RepID=UPI00380B1F4D
MTGQTTDHARPCNHRSYQLTCAQYDDLVRRAAHRCQVCRVQPTQTKHGFLVIDHDAAVGQWAVRGLLCSNYNTALPRDSAPSWAAAYLADPWWRQELRRLGVAPGTAPEPPMGSRICVLGRRRWQRTERRWRHVAKYGGSPCSWTLLNYRFGPHNIEIL